MLGAVRLEDYLAVAILSPPRPGATPRTSSPKRPCAAWHPRYVQQYIDPPEGDQGFALHYIHVREGREDARDARPCHAPLIRLENRVSDMY